MKTVTSSCFALLLVMIIADTAVCQTPIKARTESGKEVILLPDGTWKHAPEPTPAALVVNKPAAAKTVFKSPQGNFGIWYDHSKWELIPQLQDRTKFEFRFKRGTAHAIVIIEELHIPSATLIEIALENARKAAPDVRVISEEVRTVNNNEVLCMKFDASVRGIPFRYYGYYFGGKRGAIQLLTFSGQDIFAKYEQDLLELLNGLEVY